MTITEKFSLATRSFSDIAAAITEMGGTAGGGYNTYANGVRGIYGGSAAAVTPYPKAADITEKIKFCETVKEEIRQAIIDGGVECDNSVPLSAYGGKIRQIKTEEELNIITNELPRGTYLSEYSAQLEASGGKPPYTWAHAGGLYPQGLVFGSDGTISGTPLSSGGFMRLRMRCTDSAGNAVVRTYKLLINPKPVSFTAVGGTTFQYDGKPHTLNLVCSEPDVDFSVTYSSGLEAVTEVGSYSVKIKVLTSNYTLGDAYPKNIYIVA